MSDSSSTNNNITIDNIVKEEKEHLLNEFQKWYIETHRDSNDPVNNILQSLNLPSMQQSIIDKLQTLVSHSPNTSNTQNTTNVNAINTNAINTNATNTSYSPITYPQTTLSSGNHDELSIDMGGIVDNDNNVEEGIDSETGTKIYNGWSKKNVTTIRNWKASISKATYIYEYVSEKYKSRVNTILIVALILSTTSSVVSAVSSALLAMNDTTYIWAAFGLNIALFVFSAIVTILNGTIKITQWDVLVNTLTKFVEKLDTFYAIISGILVLPPNIRGNAVDFIKKENTSYLNIMMQSPDIKPSDFKEASVEYYKFMQNNDNNFKFSQKYFENDSIIEVI